jgi:hypothetical protein
MTLPEVAPVVSVLTKEPGVTANTSTTLSSTQEGGDRSLKDQNPFFAKLSFVNFHRSLT